MKKNKVKLTDRGSYDKVVVDFENGEQIEFVIHPTNRSIIVTLNRDNDEDIVVRPIVSNQFEIKLIG